MSRATLAAAWLVCVSTAWPAVRGQDESAADAIWAAVSTEPADARVWVDAARVNAAVAPWQSGWPRARERVQQVAKARRARLAHDRGGRRRPLGLVP